MQHNKKTAAKGSFESRLIKSMEQAVDIAKGKAKPARAYSLPMTARDTTATEAPIYGEEEIIQIRKTLGVSQRVFSDALNVSLGTVRSWEQGVRKPEGSSVRLLEVAAKFPQVILQTLLPTLAPARSAPVGERRISERRTAHAGRR